MSPAIGALEDAGVIVRGGAGVDGGRRRRINGQGLDIGVQIVSEGRPVPPACGALEDPAVLRAGGDRGRHRRSRWPGRRQRCSEAGGGGRPASSAVSAPEDASRERAGVEGGRRRRINSQGKHIGAGQASVDGRPVAPAVGALEGAAPRRAGIEGSRSPKDRRPGPRHRCWSGRCGWPSSSPRRWYSCKPEDRRSGRFRRRRS